jgi:MarR family transcriptional regulator, organic hydroperoxide resistance regulator
MDRKQTIKDITGLQRELMGTMRRYSFRRWMTLNMSTAQVKSLFCIVENRGISSGKLAELLGVTPANVTGIVDRLIEQGLVRRVESTQDRRVAALEATDAGKTLMESLEQLAAEHLGAILGELDESELEHLNLGLTAFLRAAKHNLGSAPIRFDAIKE